MNTSEGGRWPWLFCSFLCLPCRNMSEKPDSSGKLVMLDVNRIKNELLEAYHSHTVVLKMLPPCSKHKYHQSVMFVDEDLTFNLMWLCSLFTEFDILMVPSLKVSYQELWQKFLYLPVLKSKKSYDYHRLIGFLKGLERKNKSLTSSSHN